jgi:gluconolactonase
MTDNHVRGRISIARKLAIHGVAAFALMGVVSPVMAQGAAGAPAAAAQSGAPVLKKDQIDALLATPDKVVFVDLRRPDELAAIGGLPVYLNIQISELDRFLSYIPRDRQVVTVSNHAGRAQKAASILSAKGFNVIGAVGAENYAAEGGALYGKKYVTSAIPGIVAADTRVEVIREGFEGTEGPVVLPDGSILFTENRADRIVKIAPDGTPSTFLEKTKSANSLAINSKGEIVAVQTAPSAIAIVSPTVKTLATTFNGKPFNRPNDLAVAKTGDIYFSDPGAAPTPTAPQAKTGFYWLNPKGKVTLVADDIRRPNGVALSADEKTVYVANTGGEYLIAYAVNPNGSLANRRDFAKLAGFKNTPNGPSSGADGIVVDEAGRVYVATSIGIEIFSPEGSALGTIALPKQPQNLAFGGKERKQLYAVGRGSVYRIATQTRGVDRPGK